MSELSALWVTNMWPDENRPWYGVFIRSQAESLERLGIRLDVVYIPGYRSTWEYGRALSRVQRAVRAGRYDLVHAHYGHSGVVARSQLSCPLVVSFCGDDLLGTRRSDGSGACTRSSLLLARGFAQLSHVVTATITKSEQMAARLPRRRRPYNHVIPNGVDLSRFKPSDSAAAKRELGWSDESPNVLFAASPAVASKNVVLAQAVCEELSRRASPVRLRIASGVEPEAMPVWMNAADVLLFPSLSEGSPNVIKEAMAVELPIVSAPVGDVPERLRGLRRTYVVPYDAEAMADAVLEAASGGRAVGAREAIAELSTERVAARVLEVYREVVL